MHVYLSPEPTGGGCRLVVQLKSPFLLKPAEQQPSLAASAATKLNLGLRLTSREKVTPSSQIQPVGTYFAFCAITAPMLCKYARLNRMCLISEERSLGGHCACRKIHSNGHKKPREIKRQCHGSVEEKNRMEDQTKLFQERPNKCVLCSGGHRSGAQKGKEAQLAGTERGNSR